MTGRFHKRSRIHRLNQTSATLLRLCWAGGCSAVSCRY